MILIWTSLKVRFDNFALKLRSYVAGAVLVFKNDRKTLKKALICYKFVAFLFICLDFA